MDPFASSMSATSSLRRDFYASHINGPLKDAPIVSLRSLEDGGDVFDDDQLAGRISFWRRLISLGRRKHQIEPLPLHDEVRLGDVEKPSKRWRGRRWAALACTTIAVLTLCFL
jgi:hypothetical protein